MSISKINFSSLVGRFFQFGKKDTNVSPVFQFARKKLTAKQVVDEIISQAKAINRQDVQNWLSALRSAQSIDTPRLSALMKVYDALLIDNHLASVVNTRKLRVLGQPFTVIDSTGTETPERKDLINTPWFYNFLDYAMDSIFKGYGIIELGDVDIEGVITSCHEIPREHIVNSTGEILLSMSDSKGILWKGTEYEGRLIEVGQYRNLGLLMRAAPTTIQKKNVFNAWSEYTEIFGMPIRVGKIASKSPDERAKMEQFLQNMGSAPYAVIDETDKIEFAETKGTGSSDVYDKFIERANTELSKLILGQTMTTDNGSSKSQSEVHERIADDYTAADRRFVEFIINYLLFPKLSEHFGYDLKGCKFKFNVRQEITEIDIAADNFLIENFEIPDSYFSEKYGVPVKKKTAPSGKK